jgi:hypothetical protein
MIPAALAVDWAWRTQVMVTAFAAQAGSTATKKSVAVTSTAPAAVKNLRATD